MSWRHVLFASSFLNTQYDVTIPVAFKYQYQLFRASACRRPLQTLFDVQSVIVRSLELSDKLILILITVVL